MPVPSLDGELEGGAFALESTADAFKLHFSAFVSVSLPFLTADSVAMKGSTAGISSGIQRNLNLWLRCLFPVGIGLYFYF